MSLAAVQLGVEFNQTSLHPLGLVATIVLGLAVFLLPRRYAGLPVLAMACLIAPGQRLVLAGFDFNLMRLIILFGLGRIFLRGELGGFRWKRIDTAIVAWSIVGSVAYVWLWGDRAAVVTKLGRMYDALGMYFFFRCVVRNWADLDRTITSVIILAVPVALAFVVERVTQRNPFALLGGVPAVTDVREGRLRCQGPFPHAILAGCFWAALLPLIVAKWWHGPKARRQAVVGAGSALLIILLCASSTPVAGVMAAAAGGAAFFLRRNMRAVRWTIVVMLVTLHMVMKAPVWHLIARIDLVGGSTGWHRYYLIDRSIHYFGEWWLVGTESTRHWGRGLNDVTNQYILEGVRGGVFSMLLFILIIALAFGGVGRSWRKFSASRYKVAICWALGVSLLTHAAMFIAIAITYAHQNLIVWYFLLAAIAGVAPERLASRRSRAREKVEPALQP